MHIYEFCVFKGTSKNEMLWKQVWLYLSTDPEYKWSKMSLCHKFYFVLTVIVNAFIYYYKKKVYLKQIIFSFR